ncbi:toll-like receptor 7 [Rhinatrema bivittatum]|uniref:toll-like receptor 7 n=1 Tax=Rhinatrema bivittatum TaxID=194408 RepID=UPI00112D77BF|nr:toll-like receptor 7 [Rhinatrema bivittatum]
MCTTLLGLVFLVLSSLPVAVALFPRFMPCDDTHNSTKVDCSQRNLTSVPVIQFASVQQLDLAKNSLVNIANDSFSGVLNLHLLNLSWNCEPGKLRTDKKPCKLTIDQGAFVKLQHLQNLNLAANSLTTIPLLPSSLQELNLELNNILVLGHQNLSKLFVLKSLYLGMNCYYRNPCNSSLKLMGDVFKDTKSLNLLSLKFNNLTAVPCCLPSSLLALDLSENKISEIRSRDFSNLTSLKFLDLQWNCQRCDHAAQPCFPCQNNTALQFSPDAFHHLKNLINLSLRGNSINNLNDSFFNSLVSLRYLDLSDNFLSSVIENGTFFSKLTKVENLNLQFNYNPFITTDRLTLSPDVAKMQSLKRIFINGYFFKNLDEKGIKPLLSLPNLEMITFRTNFIEEVNLTTFSSCQRLKYLDLSENSLTFPQPCRRSHENTRIFTQSFYKYPTLDMYPKHRENGGNRNNYVGDNIDFNFPSCRNYEKSLDLSFNSIQSIEPKDFQGLGEIECLNISYNYISQHLNGSQFSHLKSLRLLDLSYNRFDLYYIKAFSEIPKLEVLYLNNNEYQFIMKSIGHSFEFLKNLSSLKILSLSYNNIGERISKELRSSSLESLIFRCNRLDILWQSGRDTYLNIFKNLPQVTFLDISYNQINFIPVTVFDTLPKGLKKLYINNNQLHLFHWEKLDNLNSLQVLDLSWNVLQHLPKVSVSFGRNFTFLNLGYNKISSLNQAFFSNSSSLKRLILSHNHIQLIDENSFSKVLLRSLEMLDVSGNPLQCTCDASWFLHFLKSTSIYVNHLSTNMICNVPESKHGQLLLSTDFHSCQDIYGHLAFICTALMVTFGTLLPILKKLFGWDIWYTSHFLQAVIIKGYSKLPTLDNDEYDAFIAFDTQDSAVSDWVYNELVVHLEERGRRHFKLCLEERDWIAGKSKIENLYEAIYKSKKTIFILTRDGFACGLLRQVFFLTQQRLLDEKVDVVLLVILDKGMKMSQYILSRKRLCQRSVLYWTSNPKAHPFFWYSMHTLLVQNSQQYYNSRLRKCIDN